MDLLDLSDHSLNISTMDNEQLIIRLLHQSVKLNGLIGGLHKLGFESESTHDEIGYLVFDLMGYREAENSDDLSDCFFNDYVVFLEKIDGRKLDDRHYVQKKTLDLYHVLKAVKATPVLAQKAVG